MASQRRNMFNENEKQETTEIGSRDTSPRGDHGADVFYVGVAGLRDREDSRGLGSHDHVGVAWFSGLDRVVKDKVSDVSFPVLEAFSRRTLKMSEGGGRKVHFQTGPPEGPPPQRPRNRRHRFQVTPATNLYGWDESAVNCDVFSAKEEGRTGWQIVNSCTVIHSRLKMAYKRQDLFYQNKKQEIGITFALYIVHYTTILLLKDGKTWSIVGGFKEWVMDARALAGSDGFADGENVKVVVYGLIGDIPGGIENGTEDF
ncbi:hypothetical protein AAG570_004948 [Ranatra chinensis]|uniref:Uncharacterized protein n=1 Tax=Ranatra chinensis TaxID=642074 RepID=A0ABD0Y0M4_9HEMI